MVAMEAAARASDRARMDCRVVQGLRGWRKRKKAVCEADRALRGDRRSMTLKGRCRFCEAPLSLSFADLGMSPLSNAYLKSEDLNAMERFYPLHAWVCESCYLVQLEEFENPQRIFGKDYAYFSSYSDTWL